ncbi:MAG: TrpB-like pyridoxal-phosphate dependent enzyme, partial [Bacteroidia bacterium]|nr:TrpB-like pyridoxal-phosphate dependent enzyme [Bacteroidia bacterium]
MTRQKKIFLDESEMPKQWYNIAPDLPTPLTPPLGPGGVPITPEMLAPVFPMNLIEQEVSTDRWIDIPEPIREVLVQWRPSPLIRAYELEAALGTPAKIYYKFEGNNT